MTKRGKRSTEMTEKAEDKGYSRKVNSELPDNQVLLSPVPDITLPCVGIVKQAFGISFSFFSTFPLLPFRAFNTFLLILFPPLFLSFILFSFSGGRELQKQKSNKLYLFSTQSFLKKKKSFHLNFLFFWSFFGCRRF